jgi:hypothetical protein
MYARNHDFSYAQTHKEKPRRGYQLISDERFPRRDNRRSRDTRAIVNSENCETDLHVVQAAQWGPEVFSLLHENQFSPFTVVHSKRFFRKPSSPERP